MQDAKCVIGLLISNFLLVAVAQGSEDMPFSWTVLQLTAMERNSNTSIRVAGHSSANYTLLGLPEFPAQETHPTKCTLEVAGNEKNSWCWQEILLLDLGKWVCEII